MNMPLKSYDITYVLDTKVTSLYILSHPACVQPTAKPVVSPAVNYPHGSDTEHEAERNIL